MKKPKELTYVDFMFGAIEPTEQNFNILVKEYNNLVEVVNVLVEVIDRTGCPQKIFNFEEE